jgi:two-component system invasion response regulator UvrY
MKLLLVDDHTVVREGVRRLLASFLTADIHEAVTCQGALDAFRAERPDLVVLDLNLPGAGGLDLMRRLLADEPASRILIFSMHTAPVYVMRAMQAGACGYVSKGASATEFVTAVRKVISGMRYIETELATGLAVSRFDGADPREHLSARELDVMRLLSQGRGLSDISVMLGVSYKTVANACTALKQKLSVERTAELIRIAVEMHAV